MDQAAAVEGLRPTLQGRMVRTERYKYCVYSRGNHRESLVDLQADPGEMKDLARDSKCRPVLLEHRVLLAKFAQEHNDPLAASLLEDDVPPRTFTDDAPPNPKAKRNKKAAAPASWHGHPAHESQGHLGPAFTGGTPVLLTGKMPVLLQRPFKKG